MTDFRNKNVSPPPFRPPDKVSISSASSKHKDRERDSEKTGRQNSYIGWFAGPLAKRRDRADESRKLRQADKPKHRRSQRSIRNDAGLNDRGSTQRDSKYYTERHFESERGKEFSDGEDPLREPEELSSSSSTESIDSTPSDDFSSRLRELARRMNDEEDIHLLEKVERHLKDKDREMRKAVTTIARMHTADNHKRDDRFFITLSKTLRVLVQNWAETQKPISPSSRALAKAKLTRLFNAPSFSTHVETMKSIAPKSTGYLVTADDVSRSMQAYLWAVLDREVFGRFRWAGNSNTYLDLQAAVFPSDGTSENRVAQSREYHEWRAMTARLADENVAKERLTAISEQISHGTIEPLQPSLKGNIPDPTVVEIFRRALELDVEMSKQKAFLYFSYLGFTPQYDPEQMSMIYNQDDGDIANKGSWNVDLFIAPALCKGGTSDTQSYDTHLILMAAEVLCSPHQTHRAASPQHNHRASAPQQIRRAATMPPKTTTYSVRSTTGLDVIYADKLDGGYRRS